MFFYSKYNLTEFGNPIIWLLEGISHCFKASEMSKGCLVSIPSKTDFGIGYPKGLHRKGGCTTHQKHLTFVNYLGPAKKYFKRKLFPNCLRCL